jgi:hypothetical protein
MGCISRKFMDAITGAYIDAPLYINLRGWWGFLAVGKNPLSSVVRRFSPSDSGLQPDDIGLT